MPGPAIATTTGRAYAVDGDVLRALRMRAGYTLTSLAARVGMQKSHLSKAEHSQARIGPAYFRNLCSALQISDADRARLLGEETLSTAA
jgi:transcriptional regulator with XRE-family HTH domain